MKNTESNVSSLPGLTSFEVSYSLLTNKVYLSTLWPVYQTDRCKRFLISLCISQ